MTLSIWISRQDRSTELCSVVEFCERWKSSSNSPQILVPAPYHDEVNGILLMLGFSLKKTFFYEDWYHGKSCCAGWWIVLDPEKDMLVSAPNYETLTILEPRR